MSGSEVTLRKALELAVKTEEVGGRYYLDMAKKFSGDPAVAEVFELLAKDEAHHEAQFKKLVEQCQDSTSPSNDEEAYYLLRAASLSEFFGEKSLATDAPETPGDALIKLKFQLR